MGKLSVFKVAALKQPGRYSDGDNLFLQVGPKGNKSWAFLFMRDGRARQMGLGPLRDVTLKEAREKAGECRKLLLNDIDPIDHRNAARHARREARKARITFRQSAETYIASQSAAWRNEKHRSQWTNTLVTYAFPKIGNTAVADIETRHVLAVVEPIWTTKRETASRVRQRIEAILDWAKAYGHRTGDNPARLRGHMDKLLPKHHKIAPVEHHAALPFKELPAFLAALRERPGAAAIALRLLIHTAVRTGELINATWEEFDWKDRLWTIDGSRMKAGVTHRVPLSDQAIAILETIRPQEATGFLFPGTKGKPISNMAMLQTLRRMERGDLTVHGFRSSFSDWCAETTDFAAEVREMALAHAVASTGSKVEAAYRRGDLLEKRRELMQAWSSFCEPR